MSMAPRKLFCVSGGADFRRESPSSSRIAKHKARQAFEDQGQAVALASHPPAATVALSVDQQSGGSPVQCLNLGIDILSSRNLQLATGGDAGPLSTGGPCPTPQSLTGYYGFRHAGAKWGHVGLTAHRGDPRHTLAHGLSRMVNHRTLVRSIADQHPVYPHLERLDDRLFHHRDSHHRSEAKSTSSRKMANVFFSGAHIGSQIHYPVVYPPRVFPRSLTPLPL